MKEKKEECFSNRPRLMVLTSTFPRWPEDREPRFVYDLCRRLSDVFEVHVLAPHTRGAERYEIMDGLKVHRFCYFPAKYQNLAYEGGILEKIRRKPWVLFQVPFFLAAQVVFIRRLATQKRFHALHAHWIIPQGLCAVLAQWGRPVKIPILCTSHGGDLFGLQGQVFDILRRWILDRCDVVTVVSRAMAHKLQNIGVRTPYHVIPMGTDLSTLFTPDPTVPRRKATVLYVGRLVEKKGVRYLIEAFQHVLQAFPTAELWIVGSGPEEAPLKKLATGFAAVRSIDGTNFYASLQDLPPQPGSITFWGSVAHEDLPAFYRSATVTVVPSVVARSGDQEGLGLVLVEAMGCGCPVIASDLPAIRDVIQDRKTGFLVEPANSRSIAAAICSALNQPGIRETLSVNGRFWIQNCFDWHRIQENFMKVIEAFGCKDRTPSNNHDRQF